MLFWNLWRRPQTWVIVAMTIFAAYFSLVDVLRHLNLQTSQFDMGNMDQVLWNTIHGNFFQMTSPINAVHELRSAVHSDFLLLAYVPFYALWPDPRTMMIVQTLAVATGALPLFWFARRIVSEKAAAVFAIAYLLYPSLQWSIIFDVHAVVLATPLLLWAWWAAHARRWWVYGACLLAALLAKEEVGVTVALIGLYLAWRQRPRWIGFTTAVVGLATTIFMLGFVIPHSRHAPGHFALPFYSDYGSSLGQITGDVLLHPWRVLPKLFSMDSLGYYTILLWPFAFLPLIGLPIILLAAPEVAVNLLSSYLGQHTIYYQYTAVITPIILLAAVYGWRTIGKWLHGHSGWLMAIRGIMAVAFLTNIFWWAPLPGLNYHRDAIKPFITSSYRGSVARIKTLLATNDRVAVTNNIAAQFTQRPYEWAFPDHLDQADAAVVLATGPFDVVTIDVLKHKVAAMQTDPTWTLVLHDRDLYYFRRTTSAAD